MCQDISNKCGDKQKDDGRDIPAKDALSSWLRSHSDPGKDPWLEEKWEDSSNVSQDRVCSDPTYGREGEEGCKIQGGRDAEDQLEGSASIQWQNGDTFNGSFSRGLRSGWGIVSCPEKDIMAITGNWKEGELEGKGRLVSNLSKIMVQF